MRKLSVLIVAIVALGVPLAQAQVAVPEIAPASVRVFSAGQPGPAQLFQSLGPMTSIVPENPAALQWGTPSRVAAGVLKGEMGEAFAGDAESYDGNFVGLRFVGQSLGFAAETANLEVQFPDVIPGGLSKETSRSGAGLSFSWPDSLAYGLGLETTSVKHTSPGNPAGQQDTDRWTLGVSWRASETFFLGAAYGQDTATFVEPQPAFDADADHYMVGLGWRVPGTVVWHLEADWFHRDNLTDNVGQPIPNSGHETTLVNAEAIWGDWLFAASGYSAKLVDAPGTPPTLDGYTVDFGFAPLSGLTITGRFEHSEVATDTVAISKEENNSIVATWQF